MAHAEHEVFRSDRPWVTQAACRGEESDRFFGDCGPPQSPPTDKLQKLWDSAKDICWTCPVLNQCRRDTLGEEYGVWGGLDQHQRWKARQALSRRIRTWPIERRVALGKRLHHMRKNQALPWAEIKRLTGISTDTAASLVVTYITWRDDELTKSGLHVEPERGFGSKLSAAQKQKIIAMRSGLTRHTLAQIAAEVRVSEITVSRFLNDARPDLMSPGALTDFPANKGERDAWVRYANRFADADYVGQSEDGRWFLFRIKSRGGFTQKWFPAKDVRLHRPVAVVIRERKQMNGQKVRPIRPETATEGQPA